MVEIKMEENGCRKSLSATKNSLDEAMDYYWQHEGDVNFHEPTIADKKKKKKPRVIPLELQKLFTNMQILDQQALSTEELTTKGFQWHGMDGRIQHDAHELNRLLIDALERSLKGNSQMLLLLLL